MITTYISEDEQKKHRAKLDPRFAWLYEQTIIEADLRRNIFMAPTCDKLGRVNWARRSTWKLGEVVDMCLMSFDEMRDSALAAVAMAETDVTL